MANNLLNALRRNLAAAEQLGDEERAKRLKARISAEEKPAATPAAPKKAAARKKTTRKKAKA